MGDDVPLFIVADFLLSGNDIKKQPKGCIFIFECFYLFTSTCFIKGAVSAG